MTPADRAILLKSNSNIIADEICMMRSAAIFADAAAHAMDAFKQRHDKPECSTAATSSMHSNDSTVSYASSSDDKPMIDADTLPDKKAVWNEVLQLNHVIINSQVVVPKSVTPFAVMSHRVDNQCSRQRAHQQKLENGGRSPPKPEDPTRPPSVPDQELEMKDDCTTHSTANMYWTGSIELQSLITYCYCCRYVNTTSDMSVWFPCTYLRGAVYCSRRCHQISSVIQRTAFPRNRMGLEAVSVMCAYWDKNPELIKHMDQHTGEDAKSIMTTHMARLCALMMADSCRNRDIPFGKWWSNQQHQSWTYLRDMLIKNKIFSNQPLDSIRMSQLAERMEITQFPLNTVNWPRYHCQHNQDLPEWDNSINALTIRIASPRYRKMGGS